jgi:acetylornithine deacetylase/succinyl-diaminopimelate desuccinylase-like protein
MRARAIEHVTRQFLSGAFFASLAQKIAFKTESQREGSNLVAYLTHLAQEFAALGFTYEIIIHENRPFLLAERLENAAYKTILGYGHGDVILGMAGQWQEGLDPFTLTKHEGKWYGRGIADNKAQHAIHLAAFSAIIETQGHLGFNSKFIIEMGEEIGSPALYNLVRAYKDRLKADLFIASDGPRFSATQPTLFLGSRGSLSFDLTVHPREGGHHSGNWGGLLRNPAIRLAHAIASLVDEKGQILLRSLVPDRLPEAVRAALAPLEMPSPMIDKDWGEPHLSPAQRVYGWCNLEVLAMEAGHPAAPVNAIPPKAFARMQLRYVVGIDAENILKNIAQHLEENGFEDVQVSPPRGAAFPATRLDPAHPAVAFVMNSLAQTTGKTPALLPNFGGGLPNDVFCEGLGLPTLWIPHSYPECNQHAVDEHLPESLIKEALQIMVGVYADIPLYFAAQSQ